MSKRIRYLVIGCLLSSVFTYSEIEAEARRFEHLSTQQGLPSNNVYEILQGRTGFLWIATEDGLARFDGQRLRTYRHDPEEPRSLASNDLNSLYQDRDGFIWVGTWGEGLERFDPRTETFEHYRHDPEDPTSLGGFRIQSILQTADGSLWVGAYRAGLNRLAAEDLHRIGGPFEHFRHDPDDPSSLPHDHVWSLYEDGSGRLFVGTNAGLAEMDRERGTFRVYRHDPGNAASLSHDRVRSVNGDRRGRVWLSTEGGLDVLDPGLGTIRRILAAEGSPPGSDLRTFKDLVHGRDGGLWIGTRDRGLMRLDPETEALQIFRHDPKDPFSLTDNDVRDLYQDKVGNLWIGTRGGGLDRIDLKPRKLEHLRNDPGDPQSLLHDRVLALLEDEHGDLWVGHGRGLDRMRAGSEAFEHWQHRSDDPASLAPGSVRTLLETRDGSLWVGTDEGLERMLEDESGFEHFRTRRGDDDSLSHDEILTLFEDRGGDLWIGTDGGGLNQLDPASGRFSVYRHDPGDAKSLGFDRVLAIEEGVGGELWVGTDGGGLDRLGPERDGFEHFRSDPTIPGSLPNDHVFDLLSDSSDVLWVATQGGLARFVAEERIFETLTVEDGLPTNLVVAILEDDERNLWLTTGRGLARRSREGDIETFGIDDGLEGLAFNERSAARGRDGSLYFGGGQGLNILRPGRLIRNTQPPTVVLSELRAPGQDDLPTVPWTTLDFELEHPVPLVDLELAALDFTAPGANHYAFRASEDAGWADLESSTLRLTQLSPGAHTVFFRGSNNDGIWSEPTRLDLIVKRPFWQSPFASLISALAVGLLLWTAHSRRIRSLVRRRALAERERQELESAVAREIDRQSVLRDEIQRLAFMLSHDLRSPLFTAQGFLGELDASFAQLGDRLRSLSGQLDSETRDEISRVLEQEIPTALRFLRESNRSMHSMTAAYLELAQTLGIEPNHRPVDLREVIDETLEKVAEEARAADAQLEIADDLPALRTDRDLLGRILEALIRNAIEYRHAQRRCTIAIGVTIDHETIRLWVRDNGIGVREADRSRVFETFRRVGDHTARGVGMGLALARSISYQLGGELSCESQEGEGSTFTLSLPIRETARRTDSLLAEG